MSEYLWNKQSLAINPATEDSLAVARDRIGEFGYTTPTASAVLVQNATTVVIAANPLRLYLFLQNDSDTIIYVSLGVAAALNIGIRLPANAGMYEMAKKFGNLYTGAINAISSGINKNLLVIEGT